jgi:pentatricopeptide repeat protein
MIVGLCQPVRLPVAASVGRTEEPNRPAVRERALVLEAARRFFTLCGPGTDSGGRDWDLSGAGRGRSRVPVRTCNALLSALVSLGELSLASRALASMESSPSSDKPNAYSLSILLAAHGRAGQLRQAAALWARLRAGGWVDGVALNSWIGACANNGQLRLALQAFQVSGPASK